ncbi:hypothetical protein QJS66_16360 [Kocuria rhizophila]|nr:hypothetical protein QJS66_16360 [Kocuria rhizophila]
MALPAAVGVGADFMAVFTVINLVRVGTLGEAEFWFALLEGGGRGRVPGGGRAAADRRAGPAAGTVRSATSPSTAASCPTASRVWPPPCWWWSSPSAAPSWPPSPQRQTETPEETWPMPIRTILVRASSSSTWVPCPSWCWSCRGTTRACPPARRGRAHRGRDPRRGRAGRTS